MKYLILIPLLLLSLPLFADENDEVLAQRNNGIITHQEFDAWVAARIPEKDRAPFLRDRNRLSHSLSQLLTFSQMAADAREAGFDKDPLVIARMQVAAEEELAKAWLNRVIETTGDPDFEVLSKEYYLLNPGEFMTERAVDVTHLLVSIDERTEEEALALASELRMQLDEDPGMFDEMVKRHSEDSSVEENQGKFENVTRGYMAEPFEKRAFTLQIGEISEPVKTSFGYHLIRLDNIHKSTLKPFDDVKEVLVNQEKAKHQRRARIDYLNQIGSYETELQEDDIKEMLSRYFAPEALAESGEQDSE